MVAKKPRPWWRKKRYILGGPVVAICGLAGIGALLGNPNVDEPPTLVAASQTATSAAAQIVATQDPTEQPTETPTEAPTPEPTPVPATETPEPTPSPEPTVTTPLEIVAHRCDSGDSRYGYVHGRGEVRNATSKSMQHVTAVVTWYTESGDFIVSDDALVDFDPLLPGQASPYEVISRYNPEMAKCSVRFKELLGGQIPASRLD